MNKKEAIKVLISRFENELIANSFTCMTDEDERICDALGIRWE